MKHKFLVFSLLTSCSFLLASCNSNKDSDTNKEPTDPSITSGTLMSKEEINSFVQGFKDKIGNDKLADKVPTFFNSIKIGKVSSKLTEKVYDETNPSTLTITSKAEYNIDENYFHSFLTHEEILGEDSELYDLETFMVKEEDKIAIYLSTVEENILDYKDITFNKGLQKEINGMTGEMYNSAFSTIIDIENMGIEYNLELYKETDSTFLKYKLVEETGETKYTTDVKIRYNNDYLPTYLNLNISSINLSDLKPTGDSNVIISLEKQESIEKKTFNKDDYIVRS